MRQPPPIPLDYAARSPARRRLRRWLWVGLLLASLLLLGFVGRIVFLKLAGHLLGVSTDWPSQREIEETGGFKLPPGARNVKAHSEGFTDSVLYVRFTIPPDQLGVLLQSTRIAQPLSTNNASGIQAGPVPSWWIRVPPAHFEAGGGVAGTGTTTQPTIWQDILIDETNPKEYVVWFVGRTI
jgi:hypothetical protein